MVKCCIITRFWTKCRDKLSRCLQGLGNVKSVPLFDPIFHHLQVWTQEEPCSGPVNMAFDELLMRRLGDFPILRLYQWDRGWGSMGYFGEIEEAREAVSDVSFVKRWTGGGVVDHRVGHTYSLMVPRREQMFTLTGVKRYEKIHRCVGEVLNACGHQAEFTSSELNEGEVDCFLHPVEYDLLDAEGSKIAGAGQRRTREGILHQGAVQAGVSWQDFINVMPQAFGEICEDVSFSNLLREAEILAEEKYPSL